MRVDTSFLSLLIFILFFFHFLWEIFFISYFRAPHHHTGTTDGEERKIKCKTRSQVKSQPIFVSFSHIVMMSHAVVRARSLAAALMIESNRSTRITHIECRELKKINTEWRWVSRLRDATLHIFMRGDYCDVGETLWRWEEILHEISWLRSRSADSGKGKEDWRGTNRIEKVNYEL